MLGRHWNGLGGWLGLGQARLLGEWVDMLVCWGGRRLLDLRLLGHHQIKIIMINILRMDLVGHNFPVLAQRWHNMRPSKC